MYFINTEKLGNEIPQFPCCKGECDKMKPLPCCNDSSCVDKPTCKDLQNGDYLNDGSSGRELNQEKREYPIGQRRIVGLLAGGLGMRSYVQNKPAKKDFGYTID